MQTSVEKLPIKVLLGVLLGIFTGLFLGEYASVLQPIGNVYVMLMQSVVYPYIIAALLHGLGSLTPDIAKKLFKRIWLIYLFFIMICIAIVWILSLAFPGGDSSIIGSVGTHPTFDAFLRRLIPHNFFSALVKNYMPAIIIFCLFFGFSLQHVQHKKYALEILNVIKLASLKVWSWIILLTPYAAFALIANTVGAFSLFTFEHIVVFLGLFFLGCFLITFLLGPLLVTCFIPIGYKECMQLLREAIFIAMATTLSVAALPYIVECVNKLIDRYHSELRKESEKIAETIATTSYSFGQVGNLFVYLFIIFAGVYFKQAIGLKNMGQFFLMMLSYLSSFGPPGTMIDTVSFLAQWTELPHQTNDLFVELMPLTRYGQVLASVVGMAFISIVGTFAYFGQLKIRWRALTMYLSVIFLSLGLFIFLGLKYSFFSHVERLSLMNFRLDPGLTAHADKVIHQSDADPFKFMQLTVLERILKTKVLRVGYNEHMIPFAYFNNYHELVGFDVAFMYKLAQTLDVKLDFIHFDFPSLVKDLNAKKFDLAIGAIYVVPYRLIDVAYTDSYFQDQPAFIVKQEGVSVFKTLTKINQNKQLTIATFNDPVMLDLAKRNFPNRKMVVLSNVDDLLQHPNIDGYFWTLEHSKAWASVHHGYSAVATNGLYHHSPLYMAYMLRKNEQNFLWFLNYWLKIEKLSQFTQKERNYWLLGEPRIHADPHWSILQLLLQK